MNVDDDMHVVFLDRIIGDLSQVGSLTASVKLRPWDFHPVICLVLMCMSITRECVTHHAAYVVGILKSLIPADARISMSGFVIQVAYRFSRVGPQLGPRLAHRPHSSVAFPACVAHHVVSMPDSCTSQPPRLTPLAENVLQSMYCLDVGEAAIGAR